MAPKFGVYKFRNAEPVVPARDGWFRSGFSTLSSDAPTNTSQFSSVVKTNRQGVLTLTPGGDASVRLYSATGADASAHWTGKLGGAVSDWDVSRLEDNGMLVASTNGTVSLAMGG
jgi:hypothetical protein